LEAEHAWRFLKPVDFERSVDLGGGITFHLSPAGRILGAYVPVRAEIAILDNLSAHADYAETLDWLTHLRTPPRTTFITHGEPAAADALRLRIKERFGWHCHVPDYLETIALQ
jgi:metallo-beta-lactamase family protein